MFEYTSDVYSHAMCIYECSEHGVKLFRILWRLRVCTKLQMDRRTSRSLNTIVERIIISGLFLSHNCEQAYIAVISREHWMRLSALFCTRPEPGKSGNLRGFSHLPSSIRWASIGGMKQKKGKWYISKLSDGVTDNAYFSRLYYASCRFARFTPITSQRVKTYFISIGYTFSRSQRKRGNESFYFSARATGERKRLFV